MTPPFPASTAAAQPPRTALIIDRRPDRLADVQRELARLPALRLLAATGDFGHGIVGTLRHRPDCVLLGWDGAAATADLCAMLRRASEKLKLVVVTSSAEELALARASAFQACALLQSGGLALHLPGVLAGRGAA